MDLNGLKNKLLSSLGQAADATKDFAGKAADATKDFAGKAADKAKGASRIAKLSMEMAQEKENQKKTFLEIGKLYYDTHKDSPEGFFIQLCEEIALSEKAIAEKQAEIDSLKASGDAEPDVAVEFEEVVAAEEACCCAEEAAADACCCAEEAAADACCCAEEAAADACCCAEEAAADACCCAEEAAPSEEPTAEEGCGCCGHKE